MANTPRLLLRFKTRKQFDAIKRAAKISEMSLNRFITKTAEGAALDVVSQLKAAEQKAQSDQLAV